MVHASGNNILARAFSKTKYLQNTILGQPEDHPKMAPSASSSALMPPKRRKLTTTACEPCRSRKIRCNGNKPSCEACINRSQQCIYQTTADVNHANAYVDSLVNRISQLEYELSNAQATILRLSTQPSTAASSSHQHHNIDPRLLPNYGDVSAEVGSVDAMGGDVGIEDNANSGHPFYGSSSAHGFTRQMYNTILQKDSAPLLSNESKDSPSEKMQAVSMDPASYVAPESFSLLPRELADRLMYLYWDRVHVLYPFLHKPSFSRAYEDLWKPSAEYRPLYRPGLGLGASRESGPSSVIFHCAFNAVLALGMQFSDLPLSEKERLSAACLAKSKDLLRLDLFSDGNIALVQTLLLLTQYFQSTNWPNRCWNSIGLACRLAQGLGLHIEEDRFEQKFSITDREIRRRVWYGCVTLDIIVSMTLGRPAMLIGSSARSLPAPIDEDEEFVVSETSDKLSSIVFFTETVKLYRIVGLILLNVYKHNNEDRASSDEEDYFDSLTDLDSDLIRVGSELPEGLVHPLRHSDSQASPGILSRQAHVLHVRLLHARILLYRPSYLKFCRLHTPKREHKPGPKGEKSIPMDGYEGAAACLYDACELIKSVKTYSATEATGAWWYNLFYTRSAAMIFLLSAVCPSLHNQIGDQGWHSTWADCEEILTRNLPQYRSVKTCLTTLKVLRQNVLRKRAEVGLPDLEDMRSTDRGSSDSNLEKNIDGPATVERRYLSDIVSDMPAPAADYSEYLLDNTFDPYSFVQDELFADLGVDLSQPLL